MSDLKFIGGFEKVAISVLKVLRGSAGGISSRTGRPFKQVHKTMLDNFMVNKPAGMSRAQAMGMLRKMRTHGMFRNVTKGMLESVKGLLPKKEK